MRAHSTLFLSAMGLFAVHCAAENPEKVKVLDKFDTYDTKTIQAYDANVKSVATPDPLHPRVLELFMDYAKPGGAPRIDKLFPAGTLSSKYAALRFWTRSNVDTTFIANFRGTYKRKDGKLTGFNAGTYKATNTWTQITLPLDKITRQGAVVWRNGAQQIIKGGEAPDDEDLKGITVLTLLSGVGGRGNSTVGHLMFDGLELVEK